MMDEDSRSSVRMVPFTLWNTATGRQERLINSAPGDAGHAFFSRDNRYIYIANMVTKTTVCGNSRASE